MVFANGRMPCDRGAGGIKSCTSSGKFICNDGRISKSKRTCDPADYQSEGSQKAKPKAETKPKKEKVQKKNADMVGYIYD